MIPRVLTETILEKIKPGFVVGLFGARRTGKTVLMETVRTRLQPSRIRMVQGDNLDVAEILSSRRLSVIKPFVAGYDFLFIDEAQKIPAIGENLKLIVDAIPEIAVFVTGSSAFDLRGKIGQPLTGRSINLFLYPIAGLELGTDYLTTKENLEQRLIFGSYPQVITAVTDRERVEILESIRDGALLNDILALDNLKDSLFIRNLLRSIAFQVGNDVSVNELATGLGVSKNTVARYLELLEKCYVLFSLQGFSRNLRKEITKSRRFYFWDNGIRNALISGFNRLSLREDVGRLWENYCISERMKRNHYRGNPVNYYFWRTYDRKEIDLIEESGAGLFGWEFKWQEKRVTGPREFLETYSQSSFSIIHRENHLDFIT